MALNENEPVKCPECKTWWRGLTHLCADSDIKPRAPKPDKNVDEFGCSRCGSHGIHHCVGKRHQNDYYAGMEHNYKSKKPLNKESLRRKPAQLDLFPDYLLEPRIFVNGYTEPYCGYCGAFLDIDGPQHVCKLLGL